MKRTAVVILVAVLALGLGGFFVADSYGFLWFGKDKKVEKAMLTVQGMTCEGCASKVSAALTKLDGVRCAEVDYKAGTAQVCFDRKKVGQDALSAAVVEAGYTVTAVGKGVCDMASAKGATCKGDGAAAAGAACCAKGAGMEAAGAGGCTRGAQQVSATIPGAEGVSGATASGAPAGHCPYMTGAASDTSAGTQAAGCMRMMKDGTGCAGMGTKAATDGKTEGAAAPACTHSESGKGQKS